MIPVRPVRCPKDWTRLGRAPGEAWLLANPSVSRKQGIKPPNLWAAFLPALGTGFGWRCGYTATYLENGSVDHYISSASKSGRANEKLLYKWSNFRYSAPWFNSARKLTPVPDPYRVGPDWFVLSLPDLQLAPTQHVPQAELPKVTNALRWLRNDDRVMRSRRTYFAMYRAGDINLAGLDRFAPMLAAALRADPKYLRVIDGGTAP